MTLLAAALAALAAWLAFAPPADPRLAGLVQRKAAEAPEPTQRSSLTGVAVACGAVGAVVLMPGVSGVVVAIALIAGLPAVVRRLETSGQRREREDLARQAPVVCDLLSATLASGAPLTAGLHAIVEAVPPPAADVLASVHASLLLGADTEAAWSPWADDPAFGLIAVAVARSSRTGAPLAAVLSRLADDLRRERRTVVEVAARSAGVRAVLPLAACFLPAFLLLGVVPVVASLGAALLDS